MRIIQLVVALGFVGVMWWAAQTYDVIKQEVLRDKSKPGASRPDLSKLKIPSFDSFGFGSESKAKHAPAKPSPLFSENAKTNPFAQ